MFIKIFHSKKDNPERLTDLKQYENDTNFKGLEFPRKLMTFQNFKNLILHFQELMTFYKMIMEVYILFAYRIMIFKILLIYSYLIIIILL